MSTTVAVRAAAAATAAANIWPGVTAETAQEFTRIGRGLPVAQPNKFYQREERYYHVLDYATTGHTTLTFFSTANQQDGVCNLNRGEVPTERPCWITGIGITPQDLTAAGARSGAQLTASAITAFARAEEIRTILQAGLLKLMIADRPVHEAQDLTQYPQDGGFSVGATSIAFATATNASAVPFTNGVPIAGNRMRFQAPIPLLPGKQVRLDLLWSQVLTVTTAFRIKVTLFGQSVQALNL